VASEPTCFGIGYERISSQELCDLLKEQRVLHVVDVRQSAWSHRPEYRKKTLEECLRRNGIRYTHLAEAGNPFRPRAGEQREFASCRRDYARHIAGKPEVLAMVRQLAADDRIALLCYERDSSQCHRSVIVSQVRRSAGKLRYVDLRGDSP
jgi:uncharacterized protein (DUF488 family)